MKPNVDSKPDQGQDKVDQPEDDQIVKQQDHNKREPSSDGVIPVKSKEPTLILSNSDNFRVIAIWK